jgi:hypothetical protein
VTHNPINRIKDLIHPSTLTALPRPGSDIGLVDDSTMAWSSEQFGLSELGLGQFEIFCFGADIVFCTGCVLLLVRLCIVKGQIYTFNQEASDKFLDLFR